MRAVLLTEFQQYSSEEIESPLGQKIFTIEGPQLHHLVNVARLKNGESLILLDGIGRKFFATALEVSKKQIQVQVNALEKAERSWAIDLALGILKKEAMDEVVKLIVELGLRQLLPFHSHYSQAIYHFGKGERINRLIESAMIQSNNPFFPTFSESCELKKIPFENYQQVFYFSSRRESSTSTPTLYPYNSQLLNFPALMVIGPEGGLSLQEEEWLRAQSQVKTFHLPTYILRAPHAISVATGFLSACFP